MPSSLKEFPASEAFDQIEAGMKENPADLKDAIKKGAAIYAFQLKNAQGKEQSWFIDLKTTGEVGQGAAPAGQKPDVTVVVSDADFAKLVKGQAKAQNLFMQGKLKIRGDIMKATRLDPILAKAQTKAKM